MTSTNRVVYTSNFAKISSLKGVAPVLSIATGSPDWYTGKKYEALFPGWELVHGYKNKTISDAKYEQLYRAKLNTLYDTPDKFEQLLDDINGHVLLCWCSVNAFCHRHILRKWLIEHGVKAIEI